MDESLSRSGSFSNWGDETMNKSLSINDELSIGCQVSPAHVDQPIPCSSEVDFSNGDTSTKFVLRDSSDDLLGGAKVAELGESNEKKCAASAATVTSAVAVVHPPPAPAIATPQPPLQLSAPPSKIWRLDGPALEELSALANEFGHFSYYKLSENKIMVHLEDALACPKGDMIMQRFHSIASRCADNAHLDISLTNKPFGAVLCSIGDTIYIDRTPQTIGMYVQHRGIVYWLSTAHGLLPDEQWQQVSYLCEYTDRMHRAQTGISQVYLADGCEADDDASGARIRAPTPYACVSYNPMFDNENQLFTNYVDIMMGAVPLRASLADSSNGFTIMDGSLREVRDPCQSCDADGCVDPSHTPGMRQYAISEICILRKECKEGYVHYNAEHLVGSKVRCRPHQQNAICGKVVSCENGFFASHRLKNKIEMRNVLVIAPTGRVRPQRGDSGSVWVLNNTETAVAVTVGMGKMSDVTTSGQPKDRLVWLAALLHPCLDVFCTVHSEVFGTSAEIRPVQSRSTRDVTDLSLNVSRLSTADSGLSSYRRPGATSMTMSQ